MAQSANNTHTTVPSWGLAGIRETAGVNNLVLSYKAAAATHYYARDMVTVGTTAGTISKCTGKASIFDGVVIQEVNNTLGAAGDRLVPVGVKGVFELNGFVEATGETEDDTITYNDLVYLSADSAGVGAGQKVTALNSSSVMVGRSFDYVIVDGGTSGSDQNVILRTYINALEKSFS